MKSIQCLDSFKLVIIIHTSTTESNYVLTSDLIWNSMLTETATLFKTQTSLDDVINVSLVIC